MILFLNVKMKFVYFFLLLLSCGSNAQVNRYWSGGGSSDEISDAYNWFGVVSPNSGDNLYFNNTTGGHHYVYTNYGTGSWFNSIITYSGSGSFKWYGDTTYANKYENNNSSSTFEIASHIYNRGNTDFEINPLGSGGITFLNSSALTIQDGKLLNIYGGNLLTVNSVIDESNGSGNLTLTNNNPTVILNNNCTYSGLTTISGGILKLNATGGALKSGNAVTISGGTLRVMESQTIGNLNIYSGTLQIDYGKTLTLSGSYNATGGSVNNLGTIKFAGGSVTFPGSATINNGTANTLSSLEVASSGVVTLNSIIHATGTIAVSTGTLALSAYNLHLNNANLNIASSAIFDNGGENQVINDGNGSINISGTFKTRDAQGFVGTNTAIPSITPTLISGSTVEYGLSGNQAVQGGTAPTYYNITFSNGGTKTLVGTNSPIGLITISGATIFNAGNHSFGSSTSSVTMTGTSKYRLGGTTASKPESGGTYSLGVGTTIEFSGTSATSIRLSSPIIYYANIIVSGNNVWNSGTSTGIKFQSGGTFKVKSGGIFKLSNTAGFTGSTSTAIDNTNSPTVTLESGSTVEYAASITNQLVTPLANYSNLVISSTNVWNSGTSTGITFQSGGTFTVKNGATFKLSNTAGFTGSTSTAIDNTNSPSVTLQTGSTVEYAGANQSITPFATYSNLGISGSGTKTIPGSGEILVGNNLKVSSATLQIDSNKLLTVTNSILNTSGNNIIIKDSGNLVQITNVDNTTTNTNTGNIKMTRNSRSMVANDYVYWGSPVKENVLSQIPTTFGRKYIWALDGTINGAWVVPSAIIPGVGFITKVKPAGAGFSSFDFIGTPNNGTVEVSGDCYDDHSSVNGNCILLANPYPSAIDAASFVDSDENRGKVGALYFWTSSTPFSGASYNTNDYSTWNLTGGTSTAAATSNPILSLKPTGNISAGQGFFAVIHSDFNVTFNNAMRIRTGTDNAQFFKTNNLAKKQTEQNRIWLNLSNTNYAFRQTLVGYISGATNEMDGLYDGQVFTDNEINIYSILYGKPLAVQGRALPFDFNDIVPLGFKITNPGEYKIDIDEVDGVFNNLDVPIYLEDKELNQINDLKKEPYFFSTSKGTFNDRFVLRYTNKTLGNTNYEKDKNQITVFTKNKQITVNSVGDKMDNVKVYDLLGKLVYTKNDINSNQLTMANLVSSKQMLLLKITLQNGKTTNKKIVY